MSTGRSYVKRFIATAASAHQKSPNLFEIAEAEQRRAGRLAFVIRRQAKRLGIGEPANIDRLNATELDAIRFSLSKQIATIRAASQTAIS